MKRLKRTVERVTCGFTAIEISMVITIIALLALLIIPLFRNQVEKARRAAAQDEMQSLAKAEMLVYAETTYYFRFQDLEKAGVPIASWNKPFTVEEEQKLRTGSNAWNGPYISMNKFKYIELRDALVTLPEFFWSFPGGDGGPIMDLSPGATWLGPTGWEDSPDDKLLIDPWGTPYLFFGPGRLHEYAQPSNFTGPDTNFGQTAIYCLGADGMPGDGVPYQNDPSVLLREAGVLGDGDDFFVFM